MVAVDCALVLSAGWRSAEALAGHERNASGAPGLARLFAGPIAISLTEKVLGAGRRGRLVGRSSQLRLLGQSSFNSNHNSVEVLPCPERVCCAHRTMRAIRDCAAYSVLVHGRDVVPFRASWPYVSLTTILACYILFRYL